MTRGRTAVAFAAALLGGTVACSGSGQAGRSKLDVYAASSLTEAFGELEHAFEAERQDADVRLNLAGSQVLRLQIEQGAPADVFASANPEHMQALVDGGLVGDPLTFAGNALVVIVPLSNPAGIESFYDLPRAERLLLGTESVPVGRYAREALRRATTSARPDFGARVLARVVSEETNVRLVRAKVELAEADAAIVYRTDAVSSDRVRHVPIPPEANVHAEYAIAVVEGTPRRALAEAWVEFVLSDAGRAVLARHGFSVD
jgi:molybdate transport system substrate-binding protein